MVAKSHREIVQKLSGAQKSSKGAPAYSRFVNRPLGRQFAAVAFRAGLTPNVVTGVSAAFSFAAIAVIGLSRPVWWTGVLVAALLVIGYALDAADGQLARLRGGGSYSGEWLDHVIDATKISSLHLAVLISFFRFSDRATGWLLVPIGFAVVGAVMFFGMTLNDQLRRQHLRSGGTVVGPTQTSTLRSIEVLPTDYGVLCWVFVIFGASTLFFYFYTALFLGSAGFMVLAARKWFRDMRALDLDKRGMK
ncbi:MAG: CDP-alcohol phosphatidyltransferase family protein [Nakamurella sp.]